MFKDNLKFYELDLSGTYSDTARVAVVPWAQSPGTRTA